MWGIFLVLFLVAIGYTCPVELIFKQENLPNCNQVCEEVKNKTGFPRVEVILNAGGNVDQNTPVARICACKLYDNENEPYNTLVCAYEYAYNPVDRMQQALQLQGITGDVPGQLVKLFTFRGGNVSLHDTGALVLSGFYSAYVEAIRGWTSFFALVLVVIIAGWNMVLPGATTLIQKIRHKETEMHAISAAEIIRTAMAVIPAVGFFALPVPVGEDMIFMGGVRPDAGQVQIVGRGQSQSSTAYLDESLCIYYENQAQYYEQQAQYYENQAQYYENQAQAIGNTNSELAQRYREQAREYRRQAEEHRRQAGACRGTLAGDERLCIYYEEQAQYYEGTNPELAQRYREQASVCRENLARSQEEGETDHWARPRFVLYRGEQDVYMPLAVGLVGSFIEFGVDGANAVSRVVNNIIIEYQIMKLDKAGSAIREAKQNLKNWRTNVELAEKQLEALQRAAAVCGVRQCSQISEEIYKRELNEKCRDILHLYAAYCQSIRTYSNNNNQQQEQEQEQERSVEADIRAVANNIGSSFSWLSPAINSQAVLYALFVQMSAKEDKEVKLKKVYHAVYGPPPEKWSAENFKFLWNRGEEFVKDKVGRAWHWIKGAAQEGSAMVGLVGKGIESAKQGGLEIGLSKPDWFVFGAALTISSVPPASQIKNMIASIGQWASGVVSTIITAISTGLAVAGLGIPALFIGGAAAGLTALAGSVISTLGGIAVAYGAGLLFWSAAPNLVVSAVTIMRFIGYLFDIAKFMITLPFFAVGAATRRPETTLQFFGHTLKLTTTPLLIALMPLVAFVAIELVVFFFFIVPSTLILAGVSVADSVMAYFLGGMAVGFMFIVAHIVGIIVAWDASNNFIEGVYAYVNNMIQAYQSTAPQLAGGVRGVVISKLTSGGGGR